MKNTKHILCLILALTMILSCIPMVSAATAFPDVADNAWYASNVQFV